MDIAIRSVGEVSTVSGAAFAPGDKVWSYLYRTPDGLLERADLLPAEVEGFTPPGPVLCKWSQRIKARDTTEAEERRAALQSADEVFLSLFEEPADPEQGAPVEEARDRLKFFLALQLERKRILKPLGGRRYRHMPTGRELTVPDMEISAELITRFQQEIARMGSIG